MDDKQLQDLLNGMDIPAPDEAKKTYALNAAESAFAANLQKNAKNRQGSSSGARLTDVIRNILGDLTMKKAYIAVGSVAFAALAISLVTSTALVKPDFLATPTNDPAVVQPEVKKDSSVEQLAASPAPQAEMAKSKPMEGGVAAGASMDMAANRGVVGGASLSMSRHAEPFYQQQQQYFGDDQFEKTSENPIKLTLQEPVSTFSIDVDTASYSFVRSALNRGVLPPKDSVRVEELINYFDYNYETPATKEEPFKPTVAIYETPWNKDTLLLHVGIKGHDLDKKAAAPRSNLTFLIDTSGSMNDPQKLPLLIQAFTMLVDTLNPDDTIAIVTYAGSAGTVLEPTKVSDKSKIMTALQNLGAGGSTAGGEGILQAYVLAESTFNKGGVNRVILATDGDFNVGITDREQLKDLVERKRDTGIYLSVLGFGRGNYNDALMQTLAQNGNGNAAYIDSINEARKVLVDEATSTLYPIANDVKIQVEFNPNAVSEYRLIGYETRLLKREDFNNDKVDAGDIGAGHTVTAIYELTPVGSKAKLVDDLRYADKATAAKAPVNELGFLKLRYKLPGASESKLIEQPLLLSEKKEQTQLTDDVRFAGAVALFGQLLKDETYIKNATFDDVLNLATPARGVDAYNYRGEFLNLVRNAKVAKDQEKQPDQNGGVEVMPVQVQ